MKLRWPSFFVTDPHFYCAEINQGFNLNADNEYSNLQGSRRGEGRSAWCGEEYNNSREWVAGGLRNPPPRLRENWSVCEDVGIIASANLIANGRINLRYSTFIFEVKGSSGLATSSNKKRWCVSHAATRVVQYLHRLSYNEWGRKLRNMLGSVHSEDSVIT